MSAYDFPEPGLYFDAGCRNVDELNREIMDFAHAYGWAPVIVENAETEDEFLNELADEAIDYLNTLETREGYYWGFGENAEGFGLWTDNE